MGNKIMICPHCGVPKDESKFQTRKRKNGDLYKRKWCEKCRSKNNYKWNILRLKKGVEHLSDRYVLNKLNHSRNPLKRHIVTKNDAELIEIKRRLIILKRTIKKRENNLV